METLTQHEALYRRVWSARRSGASRALIQIKPKVDNMGCRRSSASTVRTGSSFTASTATSLGMFMHSGRIGFVILARSLDSGG
jgi:hypothetical protein